MSILQSKEWKLIEQRHPLVEKELKQLRSAIQTAEKPAIDHATTPTSPLSTEKLNEDQYEILIRPLIVPPFQKPEDKIINCSIILNSLDHCYHYRDENGELVAIRFARTGVVANLIEPKHKRRTQILLPCPYCGTEKEVSPHPDPLYGFIGHGFNRVRQLLYPYALED